MKTYIWNTEFHVFAAVADSQQEAEALLKAHLAKCPDEAYMKEEFEKKERFKNWFNVISPIILEGGQAIAYAHGNE